MTIAEHFQIGRIYRMQHCQQLMVYLSYILFNFSKLFAWQLDV